MKEFDPACIWSKSDGKSLIQHIEECLKIYRDLTLALPLIPSITGLENFFDLLFCAVYIHDWGKTHTEFQKVLKHLKNLWHNNRHELFSVPFAEMLILPPEHKKLISMAVLGHHKDFETLQTYLYSDDEIEEYCLNPVSKVNPADFRENLTKSLNFGYLKELKLRMQEYYDRYASGNCRFQFGNIDFASQVNPVKKFVYPYLSEETDPDDKKYWQQMLLAGAVKICDHMGSAEIDEIPKLTENQFNFLSYKWYEHQQKCSSVEGNLFLTAPTGSGKTEAALLWVKKQIESGHQGRVFYVLPYTASINAMHRRLIRDFEGEGIKPGQSRYIGVLHGKLAQYLAEYFEDTDNNPEKFQSHISKLRDMHRQMIHPFKIVTPFQILKYCYGVKGFEKGFTELAGAMLIFDEIHAYDTQTFAQIVSSLNWLIKHLQIRVMIMTATLPLFMLKELQQAVGQFNMVKADDSLMEKFTRHRVEVLEGTIFEQVYAIKEVLNQGKRVIVVCNTVANAQTIFREFEDEFESLLLHSRFTAEDRSEKERVLSEKGDDIQLLVGTQAIEVSLDIDFDVIFTEPAPLDALIQRFGRINRKRRKDICPVYVCREGGENDHYIYPPEIVKKSLQVLEDVSVIKESSLQEMLDTVYPECPDKNEYEETKAGFTESLSRLKPFMRHKEEEDAFYKRFTGVSVLPAEFQEIYEKKLRGFEFIEAEKLLVTLHQKIFFKLHGKELMEKSYAVIEKKGRLKPFTYWIVKCKYSSNLGLSEDEEFSSETGNTLFS